MARYQTSTAWNGVKVLILSWCSLSGFAATPISQACADDANQAVQTAMTPDGVEYGIWGEHDGKPAPVLFVLAGTIDGTLSKPYFRQCGNQLAEHGFLSVSIDIPCHGTLWKKGYSGLTGWSALAAEEVDFVAQNNTRLSKVLDHLIATGVADENKIAVCGTSRGGFLAIHFAAHDQRVACAAAFAPVTDLKALNEFKNLSENNFVDTLSVSSKADALAGRPVWIVIGDQDERVGTGQAIEFAQQLTAAARKKNIDSAITLHVLPEPRGHTTPKGSAQLAADWLLQHLPGKK